MKLIAVITSLVFLFSCQDQGRKTSAKSITDYFKVCDSLDQWEGGIQGVDKSDSTGSFLFAECHTNQFYDLLLVPKGNILKFKKSISDDSLTNYYHQSKKYNYENLDCYSFVIPKTKHEPKKNPDPTCDCADLDTYDYVFPSTVSVYKKEKSGWTLINTKSVASFEGLGRFKLNTVFHLE